MLYVVFVVKSEVCVVGSVLIQILLKTEGDYDLPGQFLKEVINP